MEMLEARSILIGLIFVLRSSDVYPFLVSVARGYSLKAIASSKKTLRTAHVKRNVTRFIVLKWTTM
eukprot:scaffold409495_cov28-Attheya_sp.AAC.1